jgi:hypothetical protein
MHPSERASDGQAALLPLVMEWLEEFKGKIDGLCLKAGTAAMLAADREQAGQLCGKRY